MVNGDKEATVVCLGCENECEVIVAIREGSAICLGGNKCPTGESFALSQVVKSLRDSG